MKQKQFLLATAAIAALFGGMTLFLPDKAAETFGLTANVENSIVFRWLGAITLSSAILNYLVRNDINSNTLKAVLIFTGAFHVLSLIVDLMGISQGVLTISKLIPGIIVHSLITIGSIYFLMKFKSSSN